MKPLLTFGLMAYNSEMFVEEAIAAAFSQTYQPLEIILSDDCSADRTFEIMKRMASEYRGPHKVLVNRNKQNVGVSGHINRVMELCTGQIMVIAAADDVSTPDRVEKTYDAYLESGGTAMSIHSSCIMIDETGMETGMRQLYDKYEISLESVIEKGTWLYGCTHAWHRNIFDRFGPLPLAIRREDEVLPFRSLLLGTVSYIKKPLVRYRIHSTNMSIANKRRPSSKKELMDQLTYQVEERLNNLKCYLSDLEAAGDLVDSEKKERLRKRLSTEIHDCELEMSIRKGSLHDQISAVMQGLSNKFGAGLILRWILRIIFPGTYANYTFYKYKRDVNSWEC